MARPIAVSLRKLWKRLHPRATALVPVPDQIAGPGRDQEIPRMVYQTAESRWVHPTHFKSLTAFRDKNPDLGFQLFDKGHRDAYMNSMWRTHPIHDVYERSMFGQLKADIFRYCIVFDKGGYYFDFNKGCLLPLTELHSAGAEGLVTYETNQELVFPLPKVAGSVLNPFNLVVQWAFGFRKGHPLLWQVIERIVQIEPFFRGAVPRIPKRAILSMSGPGVFTAVFRDYVSEHGLGSIVEAGEDFYGHGIFRLRGSKFLAKEADYYGALRNRPILRLR